MAIASSRLLLHPSRSPSSPFLHTPALSSEVRYKTGTCERGTGGRARWAGAGPLTGRTWALLGRSVDQREPADYQRSAGINSRAPKDTTRPRGRSPAATQPPACPPSQAARPTHPEKGGAANAIMAMWGGPGARWRGGGAAGRQGGRAAGRLIATGAGAAWRLAVGSAELPLPLPCRGICRAAAGLTPIRGRAHLHNVPALPNRGDRAGA